jgi:hypothetical protein
MGSRNKIIHDKVKPTSHKFDLRISSIFLSSLHPSFWQGGRFDTQERRHHEPILASQQNEIGMNNEAKIVQAALCTADGIVQYSDGNLIPWELIEFLERG